MSKPHKCPVCGGTGSVSPWFYSGWRLTDNSGTAPPSVDTCRSCLGKGVVWEEVDLPCLFKDPDNKTEIKAF